MTAATTSDRRVGRINTIDIVVAAAIGIVFGVLAAFWQTIHNGAGAAFGPLGSAIVAGFVCIPAILAGYIIRKPRAALLAEVVSVFGQALGVSLRQPPNWIVR